MASSTTLVKCAFGEDMRRFSLDSTATFEDLKKMVGGLFKLDNDVVVKYRDEDGDLVTIVCDEDLNFARSRDSDDLNLVLITDSAPSHPPAPFCFGAHPARGFGRRGRGRRGFGPHHGHGPYHGQYLGPHHGPHGHPASGHPDLPGHPPCDPHATLSDHPPCDSDEAVSDHPPCDSDEAVSDHPPCDPHEALPDHPPCDPHHGGFLGHPHGPHGGFHGHPPCDPHHGGFLGHPHGPHGGFHGHPPCDPHHGGFLGHPHGPHGGFHGHPPCDPHHGGLHDLHGHHGHPPCGRGGFGRRGGFGGRGFGGRGFGRGFGFGRGGRGGFGRQLIARLVKSNNRSVVKPGEQFTQSWTFRNDSPFPWPACTRMVPLPHLTQGQLPLGVNPEGVVVPEVQPGDETTVNVPLVAPTTPGRYVGFFRLQTVPGMKKLGRRVGVAVAVFDGLDSSSSSEDEANSAALAELSEMGFADEELNKKVLKRSKGDLCKTVTKLVKRQRKELDREYDSSDDSEGEVVEPTPDMLQLAAKLQEMGFDDMTANLRFLRWTSGDIDKAAKKLQCRAHKRWAKNNYFDTPEGPEPTPELLDLASKLQSKGFKDMALNLQVLQWTNGDFAAAFKKLKWIDHMHMLHAYHHF